MENIIIHACFMYKQIVIWKMHWNCIIFKCNRCQQLMKHVLVRNFTNYTFIEDVWYNDIHTYHLRQPYNFYVETIQAIIST